AFKKGDFSSLFNPAFTGNASSGTSVGTDAAGGPVVFGAIYDPRSTRQVGSTWVRDIFPGNVIPVNRFGSVAQKILEPAPIEDPLFPDMLRNMPALASGSPEFHETMLTIKADHMINSKNRLSALFNRNFRARYNS